MFSSRGIFYNRQTEFSWILSNSWTMLSMRFYSVKCLTHQSCTLSVKKRLTGIDVLQSLWEKSKDLFEEVQRLMMTCAWRELLSLPWTEVLARPCFLLENDFKTTLPCSQVDHKGRKVWPTEILSSNFVIWT